MINGPAGNIWDGLIAFILGMGVGTLSEVAAGIRALNRVIEFVAALVVAFVARVSSIYLPTFKLCSSAICISSLVWFLPGMSIVDHWLLPTSAQPGHVSLLIPWK